MELFIFIIFCFLGSTRSSKCAHQVRTLQVQTGGSVTIPCSYSVPDEEDEDVRIVWGETDEEFCLSDKRRIFSPSGNIIEKYKGRVYRERDPNRNLTEYITITRLEPTDGPIFCCRLYSIKNNFVIQYNRHGTLLQFPDKEYITQLVELMAVAGEEAIIPCYYSKDMSCLTYVIWNYADNYYNLCADKPIHKWSNASKYGRYSLVNFNQDVSLHIQNIHAQDHQSYCCVVSTAQATLQSKQFTKLIIADYQSSWDQPTDEIRVQEGHSVNLTCSYTLSSRYTEREVMQVNVYWRVGTVTGPYAYHPYQDMVHYTYINRTSITGMTNLMIENVTKADNTLFHCFVVIKLCADDNQYEDNIQYGGGTKLIFKEPPWMLYMNTEFFVLPAYVAVKFVIAVILVALSYIYGRDKNTKRSD